MARIRISIEDLINALEDHCYYTHYYLDRETGGIIIQSEHDLTEGEELAGEIDNPFPAYGGGDRYIPLEPMESRRGFDIMNAFSEGLPDGAARDRLLSSLSKKKPFRHFKDALYDYPDIQKQWHSFHNETTQAIAEEWLKYNDIDFELVPPGGTSM
jgi:hypothetical protein